MNRATKYDDREKTTSIRSLMLIGVAMCLFAGACLAQNARPKMTVQLDLSLSPFAAMSASDQEEVSQAVTEDLAKIAARSFGFLDWVPHDPAIVGDANWTVKIEVLKKVLTLDDGDQYEADFVYLDHYVRIDGQQFKLYQTEADRLLYDFGEPKPIQSPDELKDDLLRQLEKQLNTLLDRDEVERALFKIRLSEKLIFDEVNQQIIVPLRLSDLRAENRVEFNVLLVPVQAVRDDFDLREAGAVADGENEGFIVARIMDWSVRSIDVATPEVWVPELPELMNRFEAAHVFLLDYSPSLSGAVSTEGGVLLDPDE